MDEGMARLFVGLPLNDGARDALWRLGESLTGGRPSRRDMYHMTLCFLGMRRREEMPRIARAVERVRRPRLTVTLDRVGSFKGGDVIWAGPSCPGEALMAYQRELAASLGMEEEAYRPHVTLARKCRGVEPPRGMERITFVPDRVILYESLREDGRLVYRPRYWFDMGNP